MTTITRIRRMLGRVLMASPVLLVLITGHSCVDKFPLPKNFKAALVTGDICMPSVIGTGTIEQDPSPRYPVRIETCVYRCIAVDRPSVRWNYGWRCSGNQCQMAVLISGDVTRVDGEKDCDARDLADPPEGECTKEVFEFEITTPCCRGDNDDEYGTGPYVVTIPYITYEQSEDMFEKIDKGMSHTDAALEVVGAQNYPSRQFPVQFDSSVPPVTHDDLTEADCHHIPAP